MFSSSWNECSNEVPTSASSIWRPRKLLHIWEVLVLRPVPGDRVGSVNTLRMGFSKTPSLLPFIYPTLDLKEHLNVLNPLKINLNATWFCWNKVTIQVVLSFSMSKIVLLWYHGYEKLEWLVDFLFFKSILSLGLCSKAYFFFYVYPNELDQGHSATCGIFFFFKLL